MGELLFKLITKKAVINTIITASHLRENMTNFKAYIYTVNCNIETFNQHIKANVDVLKSRGDITYDLMKNVQGISSCLKYIIFRVHQNKEKPL